MDVDNRTVIAKRGVGGAVEWKVGVGRCKFGEVTGSRNSPNSEPQGSEPACKEVGWRGQGCPNQSRVSVDLGLQRLPRLSLLPVARRVLTPLACHDGEMRSPLQSTQYHARNPVMLVVH